MALTAYKKKRSFGKTPEPRGGKAAGRKLVFVIQKHAASRLHYDFRLELNGVLKSWAVPKGPSLNPADKRLAMLVEDHPFDYRKFEGNIPEGNYGAGSVIIWDEGEYGPLETAVSKSEQEKILSKQFEAGSVKFRMFGKKLHGEFALVRMKGKERNAWLLIKHRDQYASDDDVTKLDKSVVSARTIDEVAEDTSTKLLKSNQSASATQKVSKKSAPKKAEVKRKPIIPVTRTIAVKKKDETAITARQEDSSKSKRKNLTTLEKRERKIFLNLAAETQVQIIHGHELKFTNLNKVYWPEHGITKRDMLNYYHQVTPYILPYMKDRPQTLNRFPDGIHGPNFYQKDVTGKVPPWIETYKYFSEGDHREKHFMVCTDEASLLYIASLGCIEMNPWSSRTKKPDHPDWCVIDLDPDKKNTFAQVVEAAQVTREILDRMEITGYCKTSGSTGLHIYIPLGARYSYEDSREFARAIVTIVNKKLPALTTIERKVGDRKGKMYLDFLQNRSQATLAGPYSLRPKPGAPVSMPLHWDEVKKGLKITDFTIKNAIPRLKETGDLFHGVLGKGINMERAIKVMQKDK